MLLYNQRKEFIGIDEDDLSALDFQNIAELQNESNDFADLFVKKPGYIHNFKNFSWIDFILHSESDESKAVIHAKGKNYSCVLHVTPFHFTSEESGFAINIKNLRPLSGAEDAQASKDLAAAGGIQASPAPKVAPSAPTPPVAKAVEEKRPELDISLSDIQMPEQGSSIPTESEPDMELPSFELENAHELSEPDPLEVPEPQEIDLGLSSPDLPSENAFGAPTTNEFGAPSTLDINAPLDINADDLMHDDFEEVPVPEEIDIPEPLTPKPSEAPMLGDYVSGEGSEHLSELVRSGEYRYDPSVAANELGLPVDLIEEFIGDFIDQAHEFHDDLFASVDAGDFDNVQILSHKLKGVAANLRVEDAFDVLSVVNTSKESEEILPNLNEFYKIIARLEGKEIPAAAPAAPVIEAPVQDEEPAATIEIKQPDEGPMLIDEDVMPPMDDDDLYADLLATPEPAPEPEPEPSFEQTQTSIDDDIYDDLLASPELSEPVMSEPELDPTPVAIDDDIYDDLLGAPLDEPSVEVSQNDPIPSSDVPALNFDAQRSANELGIPVDIVNDFVQDFKEQVRIHQSDFDNAIASGNIQEINKTATLLKGMSDNLRLNEISEVLKELQSEKDVNNTAQALASLQAYADQL